MNCNFKLIEAYLQYMILPTLPKREGMIDRIPLFSSILSITKIGRIPARAIAICNIIIHIKVKNHDQDKDINELIVYHKANYNAFHA